MPSTSPSPGRAGCAPHPREKASRLPRRRIDGGGRPGQTDNYSVSDHLNAIIDHCGKGIIDYCIYDTGEIIPEFIKKYNFENVFKNVYKKL